MTERLHLLIQLDTATAEGLAAYLAADATPARSVQLVPLPGAGSPPLCVLDAPTVPPEVEVVGLFLGDLGDLGEPVGEPSAAATV